MSARYHLVTIGGEERRLRFGRAPLLDAQKVTGRSFGALMAAIVGLDIEAMQALLWAALRTEDPRTSYNAAGEIFDQWLEEGTDLVEIQQALNKAAIASGLLREQKPAGAADEEGEEEPAPKASKSGRKK